MPYEEPHIPPPRTYSKDKLTLLELYARMAPEPRGDLPLDDALGIIGHLGASRGSERSRCDIWRSAEHNFPNSSSDNSIAFFDHGTSLSYQA